MKKYKNALVIGKFMPPHKGHEYLIRFAKEYADTTHVVVDSMVGETQPAPLRQQWLQEAISGIEVYAFDKHMPQDPSDTPDFWTIWREGLFNILPVKPDVVVASMDYGTELARQLGCDFVASDIARASIPMSATQIRKNVFETWDYLLPSARSHFMKKLCLLGPESTGKSTAGQTLASKLNTIYVPEYAAALIGRQGGEFYAHNVSQVIEAQKNSEKALAQFVNKIMVCDSSAITTAIYAKELFNISVDIGACLKENSYHHYALFYPDTEYVDDIHRKTLQDPETKRLSFFFQFEAILKTYGLPYTVIQGSYEQKDEQLFALAQSLISPKVPHPMAKFNK